MPRPWMPFYVADYLADTSHLSTVEHGAYLLLIMHYWQHEGVPDDDKKLARITRLSIEEWLEIKDTISEFFDDEWRHKRIDGEIAKSEEIISKRVAAGKAGARARYGKSNNKGSGKGIANATASAIANAQQTHSHPHPHPHSSVSKETAREDLKESFWADGINWLADKTGKSAASLRSVVGLMCKDHGNDEVQRVLVKAMEMQIAPADPLAWMRKALSKRTEKPDKPEDFGVSTSPWKARLRKYRPGGFWNEGDWGPRPETGLNRVIPAEIYDEWKTSCGAAA